MRWGAPLQTKSERILLQGAGGFPGTGSIVNMFGYNIQGASISTIQAYEQTVISSESALRATEAGFEVGTRTIVDVLDATRQLYQSKDQLSNARYDYILSMLNLKYAAGDLSEDDIANINAGLKPVTSTQ
ncbi:TolC family protein [Motilimonas eburnea]|nr:TolC family protein [Motilimonas eburnea]